MGCIEIRPWRCCSSKDKFNRNMGCIEMGNVRSCSYDHKSLIETWDVLKYGMSHVNISFISPFNRNMGCIEICNLYLHPL